MTARHVLAQLVADCLAMAAGGVGCEMVRTREGSERVMLCVYHYGMEAGIDLAERCARDATDL